MKNSLNLFAMFLGSFSVTELLHLNPSHLFYHVLHFDTALSLVLSRS